MGPNSERATIWERSKSDLVNISQSGRFQQLLKQKLGGLSGTTALQRLRGWRLQRLIKIPVPSSELPTAEQPVMAMLLQLLLEHSRFGKSLTLHHDQSAALAQGFTEGAVTRLGDHH